MTKLPLSLKNAIPISHNFWERKINIQSPPCSFLEIIYSIRRKLQKRDQFFKNTSKYQENSMVKPVKTSYQFGGNSFLLISPWD